MYICKFIDDAQALLAVNIESNICSLFQRIGNGISLIQGEFVNDEDYLFLPETGIQLDDFCTEKFGQFIMTGGNYEQMEDLVSAKDKELLGLFYGRYFTGKLAYRAQKGYLEINCGDNGYVYTVYYRNRTILDKGIVDDSDISIAEAAEKLLGKYFKGQKCYEIDPEDLWNKA